MITIMMVNNRHRAFGTNDIKMIYSVEFHIKTQAPINDRMGRIQPIYFTSEEQALCAELCALIKRYRHLAELRCRWE